MPRILSTTPAAIRAREARAARAAATPTTEAVAPTTTVLLGEEFLSTLDTVRGHAATCGRLDCGHLGKSASLAVRRAVILYTAAGSGITVSLDRETPEVTAVYGVLTEAGHARPVYTRAGRSYTATVPGMTNVMPDGTTIRLTPQRIETFSAMLRGESATMIAAARQRDIETIKSHAGYLRRGTGAHDAVSALLSLVAAGRLTDRALTV